MNPEALLALMIVALYLKDSLLLLRADEAVLVHGLGWLASGSGRWRAGFGARGFKLGGREPYLANPFAPHAPVFRLRWAMQAAAAPGATSQKPLAAAPQLAWLAPFAWLSWALLFVAIPTTVLAHWGVTATLAAVALLYVNIAAALVALWFWRQPLGLAPRAFALLAFECLVCAPYAANLVRRVAWAGTSGEDFTAAAARLLPPPALAEVHRECLARIDEQLEAEAEGSPAALALASARARFQSAAYAHGDPA
jgi:hypothetical protein